MKKTPKIRITFEPPCPGKMEALLTLAIEGDEATGIGQIRRHLPNCNKCRGFLEQLKIQQRLGFSGDHWRSFRHRTVEPVSRFRPWLEEQWNEGRRADLRCLLSGLSRQLLRLDPQVDSTTALNSRFGNTSIGSLVEHYFQSHTTSASTHPESEVQGELEQILRKDLVPMIRTLPRRVDLIKTLARFLSELGDQSDAEFLRAMTEWYYGNASEVPAQLERAASSCENPNRLAAILSNWSVWSIDAGRLEEALDLNLRAMAVFPYRGECLLNRIIWLHLGGRSTDGDLILERVVADKATARIQKAFPLESVVSWISFLEPILGFRRSVRNPLLRKLVQAIYEPRAEVAEVLQ